MSFRIIISELVQRVCVCVFYNTQKRSCWQISYPVLSQAIILYAFYCAFFVVLLYTDLSTRWQLVNITMNEQIICAIEIAPFRFV